MKISSKLFFVSAFALSLVICGCGGRDKLLSPQVTKDAKFALGVNLDRQQAFKVLDAYFDPICEMMQLGEKETAEAKERLAEYKKDLFADAPREARDFLEESGLRDAELRWAVISSEGLESIDDSPRYVGLSLAIAGKVDLEKLLSAIQRKSSEKPDSAVVFKEITVENEKAWRMEPQDESLARKMKDAGIYLHVASLARKLILVASSGDTLEKQIRLYRDGKRKGDGLGGFSAKGGEILHLTVSDIGEMVQQSVSQKGLQAILRLISNGEKIVRGLRTLTYDVKASPDGKMSDALSLKAASEEDAGKIRTLVNGGLMMLRYKASRDSDTPKSFKDWLDKVRVSGTDGEVQVKDASLMLALGALFPAVSSAMLNANLSVMSMNGRKLIQGMIQANVERQSKLFGPVWPRTVIEGGAGTSDDVAAHASASAADYFSALFDMAHYGTSEWDPTVEGDLLSALGKHAMEGKTLRVGGIDWCVAANVRDETPDFVPVFVSANFNPALLLRKWDGKTDRDKRLPIGPAAGAAKSMFNDKAIVIVRKSGAAESIKAKFLTYEHLYHGQAFDLTNMNPPLLYLSPTGVVEPVGHE